MMFIVSIGNNELGSETVSARSGATLAAPHRNHDRLNPLPHVPPKL
jgi:hypothetical protein